MEIFKTILQVLQGLSAVLFIVFVMLHSPKGDGIGAIGGTARVFASQKGAEATLTKITTWIAITFFSLSFILGYYCYAK